MIALTAVIRPATATEFCSRHRIIDTAGIEHHVLVVGDHLFDDTGATIGYCMDLDASLDEFPPAGPGRNRPSAQMLVYDI